MLKQRLLTAFTLIPLLIWGILQLPTPYLAAMFSLFILAASWEWGGIMKFRSAITNVIYPLIVAMCMMAVWIFYDRESTDWLAIPLVSLFWWITATVWVLSYPRSATRWSMSWVQSIIGLLILVPSWLSLIGLHESSESGPYLVLYLISLISIADTCAYFGGRKWGKRKLAPEVSPGKTWEGVASALASSVCFAMIAAYFLAIPGNQWPLFVVLSLLTVAFSVIGDLTESMFKRHAGVKDSGKLLPGHGGVLDRIDSLTAAAPVFVIGISIGRFYFGGSLAS